MVIKERMTRSSTCTHNSRDFDLVRHNLEGNRGADADHRTSALKDNIDLSKDGKAVARRDASDWLGLVFV